MTDPDSPVVQGFAVEAPSGKDAAYENFPVGSWLLAPAVRPHVARFYAFARAADDIADSPDLGEDEKIHRLDGFAAALTGQGGDMEAYAKAHAMRASLEQTGIAPKHCLDLLAAFKQDARKRRYADWAELIAYCRLSAAPVGRYLLDLHGGGAIGYGPSDALCMALQIINHLQDCQDDFRTLDRVYLPESWIAEAGAGVEELGATATGPAMRRVFDWTIDGVRRLLGDADALAGSLHSRRLALEAAVIVDIAHALTGQLARHDPLAARIVLSKGQLLACTLWGIAAGLLAGRRR